MDSKVMELRIREWIPIFEEQAKSEPSFVEISCTRAAFGMHTGYDVCFCAIICGRCESDGVIDAIAFGRKLCSFTDAGRLNFIYGPSELTSQRALGMTSAMMLFL